MVDMKEAIHVAKKDSIILCSKRNYVSKEKLDIQECIEYTKKEYGIPNDIISSDKMYNYLIESGKTVSLYEIINWFNRTYNEIKSKCISLPKIYDSHYSLKMNQRKPSSFVIDSTFDPNSFTLIDENSTPNDFVKIKIIIDKITEDISKSTIILTGDSYFSTKEITISQDILKAYLLINKEYQNYLNAYAFLKKQTEESFLPKGIFKSYIYGDDPIRKLQSVIVEFGPNPSFFFSYELGNDSLDSPLNIKGSKDIGYLEDPHIMAKTLRLPKDYIPFKLD